MEIREEQGQWPPHTNVITYELKSLGDKVTHEAPALAVTTRARRRKAPLEVGVEGQEEYSSDEAPNLSELDRVARVARSATRELERENVILHDRERPNDIHDLEGSEMGEWEGPRIPLNEFDGVGNAKVEKSSGYDLWADLSSFKPDITFGQLLEISPVARKTLKERMPVTRRTRKAKTRIVARVQLQGARRDVKPIEIEVMVVDKVVPNVLVNGGSGLNILSEHTMKRLDLGLTGPTFFIINMANQSPVVSLGMIKDCRISTKEEEYVVTFHVIKIHSNNDTFPILLGRPWLRMSDAIADWRGVKPSTTYDHEDNRVKVPIGSLGGWIRQEIALSSEDEGEAKKDGKNDEALIGVFHSGGHGRIIDTKSGGLGPSFYNYGDDEEYAQWLRNYPESEFHVMTMSHHTYLKDDIFSVRSEEYSLLKPCEVFTEEKWILRD